MKSWTFARLGGLQPNIGGKRVETDAPAAVNHHGDFRRERKSGVGDGLSKRRGDRLGIDQSGGIVRQRIGEHRHALAKIDTEGLDRLGEQRRRDGTEPADLNAAARADLHDAVAVRARRVAEADERIERNRTCRNQPREQSVARAAWGLTSLGRRRGRRPCS